MVIFGIYVRFLHSPFLKVTILIFPFESSSIPRKVFCAARVSKVQAAELQIFRKRKGTIFHDMAARVGTKLLEVGDKLLTVGDKLISPEKKESFK